MSKKVIIVGYFEPIQQIFELEDEQLGCPELWRYIGTRRRFTVPKLIIEDNGSPAKTGSVYKC
jgi:hypothetical protein